MGLGSPEHGLSTVTRLILSMRAANKQTNKQTNLKFIPPEDDLIHVPGEVYGLSPLAFTPTFACAYGPSARHQVFRTRPVALFSLQGARVG